MRQNLALGMLSLSICGTNIQVVISATWVIAPIRLESVALTSGNTELNNKSPM
jgi:hypothetical protein